jgi:hypothetical protein
MAIIKKVKPVTMPHPFLRSLLMECLTLFVFNDQGFAMVYSYAD